MVQQKVIPIFPLPLVVCPEERLPLHIFEERYKRLVADCRDKAQNEEYSDFGINFFNETTLCPVGATVHIEDIIEEYQDGRMDILTIGRLRYRIVETLQGAEYDTARVEFFADEEPDWDDKLATEAYSLHRKLICLVQGNYPADEDYCGKCSLSFCLAQSSGLQKNKKQELLELRSENQRLEYLIKYFNRLIPQIECLEEIKLTIQQNWQIQQYGRRPYTGEGI